MCLGVCKGEGTILLIDDEVLLLDVGMEMLEYMGYKVLKAEGGREAIEIFTRHKNQIDMVILDMIMPDMGGGETYDRLKEVSPDVKVLLSTGYSMEGEAVEIMKRGCNGFIQKPFDIEQLSISVRDILQERNGAPGGKAIG